MSLFLATMHTCNRRAHVHTPSWPWQVRFLEVVDKMVGQMLRLLWQAEGDTGARYTIIVTGDHSTPVLFGDHSNEPVPLAIAHVR